MKRFILASILLGTTLFSEEQDINHYYKIAKKSCQDISDIRRELDRVNSEILKLMVERTAYVKRAGDLKVKTTKVANDTQRVEDQERAIIKRSAELGLPLEISLPSFRALIETSIQYQQEYIDVQLWKLKYKGLNRFDRRN